MNNLTKFTFFQVGFFMLSAIVGGYFKNTLTVSLSTVGIIYSMYIGNRLKNKKKQLNKERNVENKNKNRKIKGIRKSQDI